MSTPRSSTGYAIGKSESRRDRSLFWWTVAITILLGLATFSWFFSIYVFSHPEKPLNYQILTRFDKLLPPRDFSPLEVPGGQFLEPKAGYAKFYAMPDHLLAESNSLFKRHYITNYADETPLYLRGLFRVYQVRGLTGDDVFPQGLVVRARARDYPNVVIEYVFPTPDGTEPNPDLLAAGDDLALDRSSTFASVIHIARLPQDQLCFTLVPLVYGSYEIDGAGKIDLSPPDKLNLSGRLPITDEPGPDAADAQVAAGGG
jgi:hypothetical protein